MTRKDYQRIAAALARVGALCKTEQAYDAWQMVVHEVSAALAADNPRFDRSRFWDAAHAF